MKLTVKDTEKLSETVLIAPAEPGHGRPERRKQCVGPGGADMGFAGGKRDAVKMALLYGNGQGVEKSFDQSAVWFRRTAEAGHTGLMHALLAELEPAAAESGSLTGDGVPRALRDR